MKKEDCRSVIQYDFDKRKETGRYAVHHVFQGPYRRTCEKYGFLVAVTPEVHNLIHKYPNGHIDTMLKRDCQRYYETHISTRKAFIEEFGRSYL